MQAQGIELTWIVVKDLDQAITFYTQVIGLQLKERSDEFGWAELSGPSGSILGLACASHEADMAPGSNAVIAVTVANLDAALRHFISKGGKLLGKVIEIPGHVKMQTIVDPDGNKLQLVQKL